MDSLSRSAEFVMKTTVFVELMKDERFGGQGGFKGCTVDLCASIKTKRLPKFCSRNGTGQGSN